jgi:hypothetical protein
MRDGVEPASDRGGKVAEGLLVAVLGLDHESGVHSLAPDVPDHPALIRYGASTHRGDSKFVIGRGRQVRNAGETAEAQDREMRLGVQGAHCGAIETR